MKKPSGQLGGEAPSSQVQPEATVWTKEPPQERAGAGGGIFTMTLLCAEFLGPGVAWDLHSHP